MNIKPLPLAALSLAAALAALAPAALGPDSKVLGTRALAHPHEAEQPFTRSLGGVLIPLEVTEVTVRAYDNVHGYGGREMTVPLPH